MKFPNVSADLPANVVKADPFPYVAPGLLHHRVPVDVGEEAEAEAVALARVREPVHRDAGLGGVEGLAHPGVELVVGDGAPEGGLAVHHRLRLNSRGRGARLACNTNETD